MELKREELVDRMTENLPTMRAKANLTQARLAEMIGVSRQTFCSIENRKRPMSWNTFLSCVLVFQQNPETNRLLQVFEITTGELSEYLESSVNKEESRNVL